MPVAHDANAAYSGSRSDAKAASRTGKFLDNHTGTAQDATLDIMDHQGSGWTRSAADTRRPASWSGPPTSPGHPRDAADPRDAASTDPQPALNGRPQLGPGGTAGQRRAGSWPADRTPARGFPPGRAPSTTPPGGFSTTTPPGGFSTTTPGGGFTATTAPGGFSAWSAPRDTVSGDDHGYATDGYHEYGPGGDYEPHGAEHDSGHLDPITRVDPQPAASLAVPAGRRRGAKAKPKRGLASRPALLVAVVVVAAAGFGGYKFFYEPRVNAPVSSSLRLPTTAPGSSDFNQSLGLWQHIGTSAQDPDPLTVEELFPPQFVLDGSSYARTAASVSKSCTQTVYGAQLQAALQSGHCTQVARATYLSGNGQMMGTVGVLNLVSSAAASKAGQVTGPQAIIAPLSAKTGPTKKLGNGTGVVQAEVKGHYLIMMWAEFADLKSPSSSAAKQELEQFAANLVTGSANINLSTRMLTGKAQGSQS
jgi:hypothetical protein